MPVILNKTVKEIHYQIEEKAGYKLNKIVFADNTYAMEKAVATNCSDFVIGAKMDYEVTHPGKGDKPDWVKSLGTHVHRTIFEKKDFLIMAQHSMTCAKDICIANNRFSEEPLRADTISKMAEEISKATVKIAIDLIGNYV